jgi:carbamoylphosphate synthase large subunit
MSSVMITGAGGPAGRALAAQFRQRSRGAGTLDTLGVDMVALAESGFDRSAVMPAAADPEWAVAMAALFASSCSTLVIPTVSDELPQMAVLAAALGRTRPGVPGVVLGSAPEATAIAADKLLTMWALERAGVAVPRFSTPDAFADTTAALAWADGPLVVKPRVSRGGRGVTLIEDAATFDWSRAGSGRIVQSFAGGTEYSPQVYRSPFTGDSTVVVLEKTALAQGRVGNAVSTQRLAEGAAPDVIAVATAAVEALDLVGPVDLDIRREADGRPVVLEINSRFGANSAAAPELLEAVLSEWLG